MFTLNRLLAAAAIAWVTSAAAFVADQPAAEFEILDAQGIKLISADQIRSYDWGAHALTLAPGVRAKLAGDLQKSGRLDSGVPFTVFVGGKPAYEGNFTTVFTTKTFPTPCILVNPIAPRPNIDEDQLSIVRGYPANQYFKGEDPRYGERIRTALADAGKLTKSIEEHTAWINGSLLEMKSIKQGMTREQLLKVFQTEGGVSTRQWRRYAFRDCPYIKVDVKFDPFEAAEDKNAQDPRDVITQISQPFLEWGIAD